MSTMMNLMKWSGRFTKQLTTVSRGQNETLARSGRQCQQCISQRTSSLLSAARIKNDGDSILKKNAQLAVMVQNQRGYMKRKTIKRPPTKPFAFSYLPDYQTPLEELNLSNPRLQYEDNKELENADEAVKRIFSLEFGDGRNLIEIRLRDILEKVQHHPVDVQSLEVKAAAYTINIRNQMKHCDRFRRDKRNKSILWTRINARQKVLTELRSVDYDRFTWLCKELDIVYTPKKENVHKLGKRARAIQEARSQMVATIKAKKEEYRKKLLKEKEIFEKEKAEELARIEEELLQFGIKDMSSVENILKELNLGPPYNIPKVVNMSRRRMLLEKKFALYAYRRAAKKT